MRNLHLDGVSRKTLKSIATYIDTLVPFFKTIVNYYDKYGSMYNYAATVGDAAARKFMDANEGYEELINGDGEEWRKLVDYIQGQSGDGTGTGQAPDKIVETLDAMHLR